MDSAPGVKRAKGPPPAKADIASAILTNVIEHLVLLFPPNKHAFTAKAVWADLYSFDYICTHCLHLSKNVILGDNIGYPYLVSSQSLNAQEPRFDLVRFSLEWPFQVQAHLPTLPQQARPHRSMAHQVPRQVSPTRCRWCPDSDEQCESSNGLSNVKDLLKKTIT